MVVCSVVGYFIAKTRNRIIAVEMDPVCVSACGYYAKTLGEVLDLAKQSAEVSHNHPEGIKGAQAIASAIFLLANIKQKRQYTITSNKLWL